MLNRLFYRGSVVAGERRGRQKKRRKTKYVPKVQKLDERVVFASVSFDAGTGIVMLQEDPAGEVNKVTVNGTATNLTLQDQAGIDIAPKDEQFFTRLSNNKVKVKEFVNKVVLDTGSKNDFVRAGGARVETEMFLGDGDDCVVSGSRVTDKIHGQAGNDIIRSSSGDDFLYGGDGDDKLWAAAGNDTMEGGAGNDMLRGGGGNDVMLGGAGNDMMVGDHGDDTLYGGDGHDSLRGGAGQDDMYGGEGCDLFFAKLAGRDVDGHIDGGSGADIMFFSSLEATNISSDIEIENVDFGLVDAFKESRRLNYRDLFSWAGPGNSGHEKWAHASSS
jgi:Ca2+-binding RTX toxin-like protein